MAVFHSFCTIQMAQAGFNYAICTLYHPTMLTLCLMLQHTYYDINYVDIIDAGLDPSFRPCVA